MITIKIGGSVVDDLHESFIEDIKNISKKEGLILVHGGGKEVSHLCEQLGKEPKFVTSPSGIKSRYTDKETAEIFTMVMSGKINKIIVQMLQKSGINAVGISGVDAKLIRADRKKRLLIVNEKGRKQAIDGGYTGKIREVNSEFIRLLLSKGLVPVISPIAMSEEFELLNIDGDRAAAYVAASVKSDKVLFITNVDGLLMDDKVVSELTLDAAKEIRPKIGPGMEKKILASIESLEMGVGEVLIANGQRVDPVSSAIAHRGCTVIKR